MELEEQEYEIMNEYLLGKLGEQDRQAFEKRLEEPEFAAEFEVQRQVFVASRALGREELRKEILAVEARVLGAAGAATGPVLVEEEEREAGETTERDGAENDSSGSGKQDSSFKAPWIRMAAVILVLVLVGVTFWLFDPLGWRTFNSVQEGERYAAYYELDLTNRCCPSVEGIDAYNAQNYGPAIELLRNVPRTDSLYLEARFCLGVAYLLSDPPQPELALSPLADVANEPGFYLAQQANWFSGLACLQTGEISEARNHLEELLCPGCFKEAEAKQLVKKIKKAEG